MEKHEPYSTLDGFRPHLNSLARVGYYKLVPQSRSQVISKLHNIFRIFTWSLVIIYNMQHAIHAVQVHSDTDRVVNTLFVLLTTLNTLGKQLAFNLRSDRMDSLLSLIDGPSFGAEHSDHVILLQREARLMSRLLVLYQGAVVTCGAMWTIFPLLDKASGKRVELSAYFPFDTAHSPTFEYAHLFLCLVITVQGIGNVTMDCTIVAFYSQAKTQLQILRYNLEHIVDDATEIDAKRNIGQLCAYKDADAAFRNRLHKRLVRCVDHYREIVWFVREVESIFGEAMTLQFFVMAWVICMTLYKIVGLDLLSVECVSMGVYLGCMLAQLFIYCYYGSHLKVQNELLLESVFCNDWPALSPRSRRHLLVMAMRYSRQLVPRAAYVVPLSLDTYISVLKSSYSLFTILGRK